MMQRFWQGENIVLQNFHGRFRAGKTLHLPHCL
jgi:hypothetical protein